MHLKCAFSCLKIICYWSMVSTDFFISMNTAKADNLLSRDDEIFSVELTKAVTADLFCLKPYWLSHKSSFFSR